MLVSWRVQREGRVVGWVSGLGSETVGWGFLVSGFGFAVGEGDVLEERERGASEMADGMGMEDAGSVERIRGSGNGEGRSRGFLWVWGSGTPKK